jgi:phosphoglycerate dehydrogenase-like enzyme
MKPRGLYILSPSAFELIYGPEERADIDALAEMGAPQTAESIRQRPELLAEVEIIFSGWGAPIFDETFLHAAPRLRAVFYGAGSIRQLVTEAFWQRGIVICGAWGVNAVPVAEYTCAVILLSLKRFWSYAAETKRLRAHPPRKPVPGTYGSTVGLISLGMVGRLVRERLRSSDVRVIAYDPHVTPKEAGKLGVEMVSLDRLFHEADVVSLHTPWLKETEGLITGAHFSSMKTGATFINTARGAVVRESEMIRVLESRSDLFAVLDVTWPEPPAADSPLFALPNVILTPHIAGAMGSECRRLGRCMVDELRRFLAGQPLHWQITKEKAGIMA